MQGYKDTFLNHNMAHQDSMIGNTNMSKKDAFKYIITSLDTTNLQAIITTSRNIAQGVLEVFQIKGLKVPENVHLITFSEECWNKTTKLPGVIHSSRTAFTLGTAASNLLLRNIKSPKANIQVSPTGLRILMVDLAISHSTMLFSSNFTRRTGIPITFDFVPQNKVLSQIMKDIDSSTNAYDIYMYDVPWLEYMVQNSLVADISDFIKSKHFNKELLFKENMDRV